MGGVLGAAMLLSFPSCSDDHYDIKGGADGSDQTIWANLKAHPEQFDSLCTILEKLRVYTKEEDKKRTMTYAELLNSPQTFTFWAPLKGYFNAQSYLDQISQIQAYRTAGLTDKADTLEYNLGLQFAQNHMARSNYESNTDDQEVRLYNGKLSTYSLGSEQFNGVAMDKSLVFPSSNGVIHGLKGISVFSPNIYDYMGNHSDIFSTVYGTLTDPSINKRVFDEASSTAGGMNSEGNMVYVDSVFYYNNEILTQSGASIKNEDSTYVAVIPTDQAWKTAEEKVKELFRYGKKYKYSYRGGNTDIAQQFSDTYDTDDPDSLQNYNTKKALITSMYFSASVMGLDASYEPYRDHKDQIAKYVLTADSLNSTNSLTFYNPNKGGQNPLFGDGTYDICSNGIAFPVTSYDVDPSYTIMQSKPIDLLYSSNVGDFIIGSSQGTGEYNYLTASNLNTQEMNDSSENAPKFDISSLETKGYRYFSINSGVNSPMYVYFPLPSLYSGHYKISLQILPNRVDVNHTWLNKDTNEEIAQNTSFDAAVFTDEGTQIGSSVTKTVNEDKVEVMTLFEDIEIPKCYYNLPSGISNSYPILQLSINTRKHRPNWRNYGAALSIAKIFIEPVRN